MDDAYRKIIRDLREDNDKSQKDIGEVLGVNQQYYSKYETGEYTMPVRHLITLAGYYGVSMDYITGRTKSTQGVGVLEEPFTGEMTVGQFVDRAVALDEDGRKAAAGFVEFQKNK